MGWIMTIAMIIWIIIIFFVLWTIYTDERLKNGSTQTKRKRVYNRKLR